MAEKKIHDSKTKTHPVSYTHLDVYKRQEFDDYVQPNLVVESGEFDANYMEHLPYLNSFNKEQGTHLVDAGDIHYEPFGIYPGTKSKLEAVSYTHLDVYKRQLAGKAGLP